MIKIINKCVRRFQRSFIRTMSTADGRPPALDNQALVKVIQQYYNFQSVESDSIKVFPGYDARNYFFRGTRLGCSGNKGFMLKLFNRIYSPHDISKGVSEVWQKVEEKGFSYTSHVLDKEGQAIAIIPDSVFGCERDKGGFAARILHFIEGQMLDGINKQCLTAQLLRDFGMFLGRLDTALQDGISCPVIENRYNPYWDLQHLLHLREHLHSIDDPHKKDVVENILLMFETHVVPKMPLLTKGLVHGDPNGQNTIVRKNDSSQYSIIGIIDFDDTSFSYVVNDIALALMYIMVENLKPLKCPGPVEFVVPILEGYVEIFPLNEQERDCLFYLVLGRCCQSAVMGELAYKVEPWNEYLLLTPAKAYKLMEIMLTMGKDKVDKIWNNKS